MVKEYLTLEDNWMENSNIIESYDTDFDINRQLNPIEMVPEIGMEGTVHCAHIRYVRDYRQFSNKGRTQSRNRNVYRLILQLSLPNPTKPGVKSRMKM